jgi:hypothetical protein
VVTAHELIESRFKLTERICRKLNRATLDPRIIGDHLEGLRVNRPQSRIGPCRISGKH